MRFLILSASIGCGHTRVAEALREVLENEAMVVDCTAREFSFLGWLIKKFYLRFLKTAPNLYGRLYNASNKEICGKFIKFLVSVIFYLPLEKTIRNFRGETVICTHPFPGAAASLWKFLHRNSDVENFFLLTTVLTDYSLHEMWLCDGVDVYFVPNRQIESMLLKRLNSNKKVFAVGVPISGCFRKTTKKIDTANPTILVMGGGLGLGSIEEILLSLSKINWPLKIVVIVGKNQNLFFKLRELYGKVEYIKVFGYVKNVHEFMSNADLLITKPGAVTMSEAFSFGLPMILHAPLPGPEIQNARYAVDNGVAVLVETSEVSTAIEEFLKEPKRLKTMKHNAQRLSCPLAATKIVQCLRELIG